MYVCVCVYVSYLGRGIVTYTLLPAEREEGEEEEEKKKKREEEEEKKKKEERGRRESVERERSRF